jgi:dihydroorotate dehydrogenase (NAD+) catalytic subunit
MIAGASAVQLGTINFIDPSASVKILKDIVDYCCKTGVEKLSAVTGSYII